MSGLLLGHRVSVAFAGATNMRYVGITYIGRTNIRSSDAALATATTISGV